VLLCPGRYFGAAKYMTVETCLICIIAAFLGVDDYRTITTHDVALEYYKEHLEAKYVIQGL
jgi:hypothetical protein